MTGVEAFRAILGAAHVESPGGDLDGVPVACTLRPGSAEEVAACVGAAAREGLSLVASGGGTKLGWGNPPAAPALVRLDLGRLSRILDLDADEGIATLEAGVPLGELAARAQACGKETRLDAGRPKATVGGTIATDPPGAETGSAPRLRDDLLGLRVALADGRLAGCGGRVVKNVTGFDLVRLYCGSFGTLGVIVEATLRLRPRPECVRVLAREALTFESACEQARELLAAQVRPAGLALLPGAAAWRVLWRVTGTEADVVARAGRYPGEAASAREWTSVVQTLAEDGAAGARLRLASRASDCVALGRSLASHAGSRALCAALPAAGIVFGEIDERAALSVLEEAARRDWVVFVEHASAELKERIDVFGAAPETLPLMRALKNRFDPQRRLAPGRFVGRL